MKTKTKTGVKPIKSQKADMWLHNFCANHPKPTAEILEAGEAAGHNPGNLRHRLTELVRKGVLTKPYTGVYAQGERKPDTKFHQLNVDQWVVKEVREHGPLLPSELRQSPRRLHRPQTITKAVTTLIHSGEIVRENGLLEVGE